MSERRFKELTPETMTPEQKKVADAIQSGPRGAGLRGPFNALLRSPDLCDLVQRVGAYVRYSSSIPPRLNENVEEDTILINGAPKVVLDALNPDEHLIHVPLVSWPRPAPAHAAGEGMTELPAPAPHGLVGNRHAPFSEKQLDVAETEAEYMIQPHSVADDVGREAVAVVRVGWRFHRKRCSATLGLSALQDGWSGCQFHGINSSMRL